MIVKCEYDKTPEHVCEMKVCADIVKADNALSKETLAGYTKLHQFLGSYIATGLGEEFVRSTNFINDGPRLRILDIGAGRGETSLYLADRGHHVFPVEPSYDFCQVMDYLADRFATIPTIYNCSAEALDIVGEAFDVVIFNASLHHCDDPVVALRNAYRHLRKGGTLLLMNEPRLPFYKSHASWRRVMDSDPESLGDYGGNEHIYHNNEYLRMLKQAGFSKISMDADARYRSRSALARYLKADRHTPGLRQTIKSYYLNGIYWAVRLNLIPVLVALRYLSLMQVTFRATR